MRRRFAPAGSAFVEVGKLSTPIRSLPQSEQSVICASESGGKFRVRSQLEC